MANELDDRANPQVASLQQRMEQLEQKLAQMEQAAQGMDARITQGVEAALATLTIANVSGAGRGMSVQIPTGGTGTVVMDCTADPPVGNVTITLS